MLVARRENGEEGVTQWSRVVEGLTAEAECKILKLLTQETKIV